MIQEILARNLEFKSIIKFLKDKSPLYPEIFKLETDFGKKVYLSTIIRIEREGKWYKLHCVESGFISEGYSIDKLYEFMIDNCYRHQQLYCITNIPGCEELDSNQISEEERLKLELGL